MVLLIAAILDRNEIADMSMEAQSLGLQVLLEVHNARELEKYHPSIRYVGVNNRDLTTFRVDTGISMDLIGRMPGNVVPVSESGISNSSEIQKLGRAGFQLFLIGETFMKRTHPGKACKSFIKQIRQNG
jgi:indole-3-glycerol phosphate synthase